MTACSGLDLMRMRYGFWTYRRTIAHTMPTVNTRPAASPTKEYAW